MFDLVEIFLSACDHNCIEICSERNLSDSEYGDDLMLLSNDLITSQFFFDRPNDVELHWRCFVRLRIVKCCHSTGLI